jgi:hypothetical protein
MPIIPEKPVERVGFYKARLETWNTNATTIGVPKPAVTDLSSLVTAAEAAIAAQKVAADNAKSATEAMHNAIAAMSRRGAGIVGLIRGTAKGTNNPNIYVLANIPAPKTPSPAPAPGTPSTPSVSLRQDGAMTLSWKCKNPQGAGGTVYEVQRSLDGGPWQSMTPTGKKKLLDPGIPAGTASVNYQVTAVRSTVSGAPAQFQVRLGAGAGPAVRTLEAAPVTGSPMRKAA